MCCTFAIFFLGAETCPVKLKLPRITTVALVATILSRGVRGVGTTERQIFLEPPLDR